MLASYNIIINLVHKYYHNFLISKRIIIYNAFHHNKDILSGIKIRNSLCYHYSWALLSDIMWAVIKMGHLCISAHSTNSTVHHNCTKIVGNSLVTQQ